MEAQCAVADSCALPPLITAATTCPINALDAAGDDLSALAYSLSRAEVAKSAHRSLHYTPSFPVGFEKVQVYEHAGWASSISECVQHLEKEKLTTAALASIIMHRLCRSFFRALRGEVPRRLATGELSAKARTSDDERPLAAQCFRLTAHVSGCRPGIREPPCQLLAGCCRSIVTVARGFRDFAKQAGLLEPEDREARQLVKQLSAAVASWRKHCPQSTITWHS